MLKTKRLSRRNVSSSTAIALVLSLGAIPGSANDKLGNVEFQTSCSAAGNAAFNEGLTLLHHMMYIPAEAAFNRGLVGAPDCAMLNWGIGMANFHPLWPGGPSQGEVERGNAAAAKLRESGAGSDVEQALIDSVLAFYDPGNNGYRPAIAAWAAAMEPVYEVHSDNLDVAALYGLAQLSTAPRGDPTFARQKSVGDLLDGLHEQAPSHPGVVTMQFTRTTTRRWPNEG